MTEFREEQKLMHWWLWAILLGVAGIWLYGFYKQLWLGEPFGNRPISDTELLLTALIPLGLILLFATMTLKTRINEQGIRIKYFPLWSTHIPWEQVGHAEVIEHGLLGYGIRITRRYGTVYNAKGKTGLQIIRTNGRKTLLGTQRPEELWAVVSKYL